MPDDSTLWIGILFYISHGFATLISCGCYVQPVIFARPGFGLATEVGFGAVLSLARTRLHRESAPESLQYTA